MVVRFTATYAISTYHHQRCEFELRSWRSSLDTTLCDKVCQGLAAGRWFLPGNKVSTTNKTDRHNIAEILLKVVLNTIHQTRILLYIEEILSLNALNILPKIRTDFPSKSGPWVDILS